LSDAGGGLLADVLVLLVSGGAAPPVSPEDRMGAKRGRPLRWRLLPVGDERGQTLVVFVLFLTVLLGISAMAVDAGYWMWTKRKEQAVVDAAALAGAQALPDDPQAALNIAITYAGKNGVALDPSEVSFSRASVANDTISVSIERPAPGFFSRVLGTNTVQIGAHASASAGSPGSALWVAPIAVPSTHPMLQCSPPPCPDTTTLSLNDLHSPGSGNAAGSFALLDLLPNDNGNQGQSTVAGWMAKGDDQYMPLGTYTAEPSTFYNGSAFQAALQARVGDDVLFPVYKPPIVAGGSNAQFNIIGWVGFHIDDAEAKGSNGSLAGHFTRYIAEGIQASSWNPNDFGVRVVRLVQ
jgi:Flp pilus assembly protein TadG